MRLHLKLAILERGQTQRALAHALDIPEPRLSAIVRGWIDPKPEERDAIAGALHRPSAELFDCNAKPAFTA